MSITVNGTNGLTFSDGSSQNTSAFIGGFAFRNRIINGAMMIDQRNAGASVTPANGQYLVDRWSYNASQASKFTAQQNQGAVTPPNGFKYYLGLTVASAVSVGASDNFTINQRIEGFNVATLVCRLADNAFIPFDPSNTDYQAYLLWISEGNVPLPADEPTA